MKKGIRGKYWSCLIWLAQCPDCITHISFYHSFSELALVKSSQKSYACSPRKNTTTNRFAIRVKIPVWKRFNQSTIFHNVFAIFLRLPFFWSDQQVPTFWAVFILHTATKSFFLVGYERIRQWQIHRHWWLPSCEIKKKL